MPFFSNFVRLFDRNLCFNGLSARRAYLKSILLSMPCESMRQKMFSCDFLRFVYISFHFVYISRCVTHSVQRECLLVVGRGSWVPSRGSWVLSRGSWVPSRGSWVPSRGSWVPSRGSWKGSAYLHNKSTNSNVYSSIAVFNFQFQL